MTIVQAIAEGELSKILQDYLESVEARIRSLVVGSPESLYRASSHLILAGGKRLRPLVLGIVATGYKAPVEAAVLAGASIEVLHNFTLVHDDIMDRDDFRRGVPTTHKLYGEPMAILAGDLLFAKSYQAALEISRTGAGWEKVVRILEILNWASITVAEGQALDMELSRSWDVGEDLYLEMIYKKTSSLFIASALMGAILGDAPERDLELLRKCLKNSGIAFQVRDDILGLKGDPRVTGKPVLNDLREGKRTLAVIHAIRRASREERLFLEKVLGNREASEEDLQRAREIIEELGGVERAEEVLRAHVQEALEVLKLVDAMERSSRKALENLVTRLAWRES